MATPCDITIAFRGYAVDRESFGERCAALGREPSDMHRELTRAFADGRVTIEPTAQQQAATEGLYTND